MKAAAETLDSIIVIKRSRPLKYRLQHLCIDKGYDFPEIEQQVTNRKYVQLIRHRREKKRRNKKRRYKRRR
jgi:hypothetical protein